MPGTSPRMTMLRGGLLGERVADAVFPKANGPGGFQPSPFIECADLIADQSGFVKRKLVRRLSIGSAALRRRREAAPRSTSRSAPASPPARGRALRIHGQACAGGRGVPGPAERSWRYRARASPDPSAFWLGPCRNNTRGTWMVA